MKTAMWVKKGLKEESREIVPEIADNTDLFDNLVKNDHLQMLLHAIYQLNELDKSIMLLYLEEKSYEEIANIIGISISNVGVRINRAKETLKNHFTNMHHGTF